jgi:hypothetical protein
MWLRGLAEAQSGAAAIAAMKAGYVIGELRCSSAFNSCFVSTCFFPLTDPNRHTRLMTDSKNPPMLTHPKGAWWVEYQSPALVKIQMQQQPETFFWGKY